MTIRYAGLLCLFMAGTLSADQVCFDSATVMAVNVSSMDYVAPATSPKTKAVLLKDLYQTMYERENFRQLWLQAIFLNDQMLRDNANKQAVIDACIKAGATK